MNARQNIIASGVTAAILVVLIVAGVWALMTPPSAAEPVTAPAPTASAAPTYGPDELFDAVVTRNVPGVDLVEARTIAVRICTDLDAGMLTSQAAADAFTGATPMDARSQSVIVGTSSAFCPAYTAALSAEARLLYPTSAWTDRAPESA